MDRQAPDYGAASASAMVYAQQQQQQQQQQQLQAPNMQQQQQFGFHPQHQQQQFPPPPFIPPHPSMQQFTYPHHLQQQQPQPQLHPHPYPPHPHLLYQQQPPPCPPHLPPLVHPSHFHGSYDSAPPPAPPPSDPELQKVIDKLVEYSTKNGPEFEAMIREKQRDNPAYSFLFGGEGYNYYLYKLWLSTHPSGGPLGPPFPPSSMSVMQRPPNPMMSPAVGAPQMYQQPFSPFYDPQQHQQPFGAHGQPDFDPASKSLKVSLPPDVAMELSNVLNGLNGTKEFIKGAKTWFMQRSLFVPAMAEALRERIFTLDDSERQLHIIYLVNDILFDSLQRRTNPHDLDNEALAFKPVLGSMFARIYHNPQNKDENQSRLQKILQFWASKEVYDQETIHALESEMVAGPVTNSFLGPPKELSYASSDSAAAAGFSQQAANQGASHWQPDWQGVPDQDRPNKLMPALMPPSLGNQQFIPSSIPASAFPGSVPINSVQPANQQSAPLLLQAPSANICEKLPPYPLFPPGLIPGMVRKMQIGSGVPYSPLSPLDIPTIIPPSNVSPSEILERVSKFFKEIGEVNPSEGLMKSNLKDKDDDEYEREPPIRKGGACIPPPPNLQVDEESGTYADGSMEQKPGLGGSGRLGQGATTDPNEPSQYDDVYTSYRKQ